MRKILIYSAVFLFVGCSNVTQTDKALKEMQQQIEALEGQNLELQEEMESAKKVNVVPVQPTPVVQQERDFQKKEDCSRYIREAKQTLKRYEEDDSMPHIGMNERTMFMEMFYSPKENSCFYAYEQTEYWDAEKKTGFYAVINVLTGERIIHQSYIWNDPRYSDAKSKFMDDLKYYYGHE